MNILVIDDERELLEKLKSVLMSEHYTVETAGDGKEGLDKVWNDTYDLILLDIMLPGMNGLEVLSEIRAAGILTPVLMLTAKGDIKDKIAGLNLGADDYLANLSPWASCWRGSGPCSGEAIPGVRFWRSAAFASIPSAAR